MLSSRAVNSSKSTAALPVQLFFLSLPLFIVLAQCNECPFKFSFSRQAINWNINSSQLSWVNPKVIAFVCFFLCFLLQCILASGSHKQWLLRFQLVLLKYRLHLAPTLWNYDNLMAVLERNMVMQVKQIWFQRSNIFIYRIRKYWSFCKIVVLQSTFVKTFFCRKFNARVSFCYATVAFCYPSFLQLPVKAV